VLNKYSLSTKSFQYLHVASGAAGAVIGGIGTIASMSSQSSAAASQKAAAADQQAMLAKQAFMNALALNSAQNQLAYDYDTADLQQRGADLQAVQQNFQNLMQAREQHLSNSGQVDQGRFQAQKQYFGTLFNQAQQSTSTVFNASQEANNRMFQSAIAGMQARAQTTKQGQDSMFGAGVKAMQNEQQVSSAGLNNMLQVGEQTLGAIGQTQQQTSANLFNTGNQAIDEYTNASVARSQGQSQGFQAVSSVARELEGQARDIQNQQQQVQQQQSALEAVYSGLVGGNIRGTASGQNMQDRQVNQSTTQQQQFETTANQAISGQMRENQFNDQMLGYAQDEAGILGGLNIDNAAETGALNNQNIQLLSLMQNLNAMGNYNRDTTFARDQGTLDATNAANQFGIQNAGVTGANALNLGYNNFQNTMQNQFLSNYQGNQDRYVQGNASNQLQQTNAGLNNFLLQSLRQKQLAENNYQQSNSQIHNQSAQNQLGNMIAMLTGYNNASLQSDANATLNQAQQAAIRAQASSIRSPSIFDYLGAGAQMAAPFMNNKGSGTGSPIQGYTNSPTFSSIMNPSMNSFMSGGFGNSFGNPASYSYASAPSSLGLGTFQSGSF